MSRNSCLPLFACALITIQIRSKQLPGKGEYGFSFLVRVSINLSIYTHWFPHAKAFLLNMSSVPNDGYNQAAENTED